MTTTTKLAALAAAALVAVPGAAVAKKPDHAGGDKAAKQERKQSKKDSKKAEKGAKLASFVLKGTYAGDSAVAVTKGNGHAKRADLVGETLTFDFSAAKVVVADVDGSGVADLADVQVGDKVVVKVKAPRASTAADVLKARQLVDQTHPAADDDDADEASEPVEAAEAPEPAETPEAPEAPEAPEQEQD